MELKVYETHLVNWVNPDQARSRQSPSPPAQPSIGRKEPSQPHGSELQMTSEAGMATSRRAAGQRPLTRVGVGSWERMSPKNHV